MDEQIKDRFDQVDKRIDDVKWYVGGTLSFILIIFGVASYIFNHNFDSEKNEIKESLGKTEKIPNLQILDLNKQSLDDKEIPGTIENRGTDSARIKFGPIVLFNDADGSTGSLYSKTYTKDIILSSPSTDNSEFKYEASSQPKDFDQPEMPGHFSMSQWTTTPVSKTPESGRHVVLLKYYYGKGKVTQAKIIIRIP